MVRSDGRKSNFNTRVPRIRGRTAQLDTSGASQAQKLSICTIGREDPTAAEALRANILLKALQNIDMILDLPLVQDIWFPKPMCNFQATISQDLVPITFDRCRLNDSQKAAVHAIFSNEPSDRIVLIQGPPGTGKTTVIAATVLCLVRSPRPGDNIWLIAQSNVAVKNIAEKLAASAFLDFKILVSKDFHFDWYATSFLSPWA
jgi:regulator of nonsense transcripts 1